MKTELLPDSADARVAARKKPWRVKGAIMKGTLTGVSPSSAKLRESVRGMDAGSFSSPDSAYLNTHRCRFLQW